MNRGIKIALGAALAACAVMTCVLSYRVGAVSSTIRMRETAQRRQSVSAPQPREWITWSDAQWTGWAWRNGFRQAELMDGALCDLQFNGPGRSRLTLWRNEDGTLRSMMFDTISMSFTNQQHALQIGLVLSATLDPQLAEMFAALGCHGSAHDDKTGGKITVTTWNKLSWDLP